MAPADTAPAPNEAPAAADSFTVLKQQLELDFSFNPRRVQGRTTLDIQPDKAQLREIVLNCRQLTLKNIIVQGEKAAFTYYNLHKRLTLYPHTGLEQYHFPKERLARHTVEGEDELVIHIPDKVKIRELKPAQGGLVDNAQGSSFSLLKVEIEYELDDFRDGLHFVGVEDGDARFPHAYTRNSPFPGSASCLFPCIDDGATRCFFEVSITYPRTLGDALTKRLPQSVGTKPVTDGVDKADSVMLDADDDQVDLSVEEKAMEMSVICSGTLTDDIADPTDPTRKTASFSCDTLVLPQHIGFVVGPFEHVDLSDYRDLADDERLGSSAIKVHAFCLPGKEDEVRNSAMMLARALDNFTDRYQSYAFGNAYKLAFVDDLDCDTAHTASFSICSSRLLFPETVWEPLEHTTRVLVHAVASQWIGVDVVARKPEDYWIAVGGSWFMAELYLRELFGRNDWRFRQKLMNDRIFAMDRKRPSLQRLGEFLQLDPGEQEFMELKSYMVLSILHNRLVKQSGKNGVDRCLYRMLFNARQGKYLNGAITTTDFLEICEKVGHQKLESFFNQWIAGSGCPTFECFPSFNKKKQVVQLQIRQTQADPTITTIEKSLASEDFMREAKEKVRDFRPVTDSSVFVGPMTIRIHEADGTPYEHIVDINSNNVKVEIPYNTKYKRLKRNRLNKERMAAAAGLDATGEGQEDVTFYMLGDLFTTPEEHAEWRLDDWPPEDEAKMEQEAYEWIRVDADFEWISRTNINDMPSYMYVSQLQQDKDVVAQAESIRYLADKEGHRLISTFLIKTLMDNRYFHGIRNLAAQVMAQSALKRTDWIGLFHLKKAFGEMFCLPGSPMTRSNDFSDRSLYLIQCAIPRAIAKIKGEDGKAPIEAKRFLLDVVRYNDNRGNDYSDDHYISTLMRCLAECLATSQNHMDLGLSIQEQAEEADFTEKAIGELTRHQRLDEWIPTYQNIYTTTALDCAMRLIMARVTPFRPTEFLQYAQLGNADNVRLKAWECLVRLGMARKDTIVRFLIHEIHSDPSPYFRKQMLRIFGLAVGQIATGDVYEPIKAADGSADALIVENDAGSLDRASAIARQNLYGALRGLRTDLQGNLTLKIALEEALKSTTLSTSDISELLDFCEMVFSQQKQNKLPVVLQYPRYWRVQHLGKGELRFWKSDKFRTKATRPLPTIAPPPPPPPRETPAQGAPIPTPLPKLSLKIGAKSKASASASSPPPLSDTINVKSRSQSIVFSPTVHHSPSPIPTSIQASPAPPPAETQTDSRASTPDIPLMQPSLLQKERATPAPISQTPIPLPVPAAKPVPSAVSKNASARTTPSAIPSPVPPPAPKLKIKTKTSTVSSPRPSAAPSPRPGGTPAPGRPASTASASSAAPKAPKPKKSKIVKLRISSAKLAGLPRGETGKKRKLVDGGEGERPAKRQSVESEGMARASVAKSGLVKVERGGAGEKTQLIIKISIRKGKMAA